MAYVYRLIVVLILAVFSLQATAAIAPVVKYRDILNRVDTVAGTVAWWQAYDPKFACIDPYTPKPATWEARNVTPQKFDLYKVGSKCDSSGTYNDLKMSPTASGTGCPDNSTLSGGSCTCNAGYTEINGACEARNENRDRCFSFSVEQTLPGGALVQDYRLQGRVSSGAQFCMPGAFTDPNKGCKVTFTSDPYIPWMDYGGGKVVSEGTFSMSSNSNTVDQSCNAGPDTTPPKVPEKEKCPSGYTGTVNGVEVCVNKVPDSGADGGRDQTETNNGTETTTRRVDRSTTCEGGTCTTVTTTTITTRNNSTGATTTTSSSETSTSSKPSFCEKTPSSKLCKDGNENGSSFSGSCGGGFACEGDAIQCAMAQEQHRRACKLFDDKESAEYKLYEAEKGKTGSRTGDLPGNETIAFGQSMYDASNALGPGTCISDLPVDVLGQTVSLPISQICPHLATLRLALLAFGALLWVLIVFRG